MEKADLDMVWDRFRRAKTKTEKDGFRHQLAAHYFQYVQNIGNSLSQSLNFKAQPDELASHGVEGLYKAIDGFDHTRGVKFETYAYPRIWGSMIDGIRSEDWVPRSVRMRQNMLQKTREKLEQENGIKVSEADVLVEAGIDEAEYHRNYKKYCPVVRSSIEHCLNPEIEEAGDNKKDFNKYLVANNVPSQDSKMVRREFLSKLMGKNFTKQERLIIVLYYYEQLTMKEIATRLDMSESRVSQIHQDVIRRFKVRVNVNPDYFNTEDILDVINDCNDKDTIL